MGKPVSKSYFEQHEFTSQFESAERVAEKYQITRQDTDGFGLESRVEQKQQLEEGYRHSNYSGGGSGNDENFEKTGGDHSRLKG